MKYCVIIRRLDPMQERFEASVSVGKSSMETHLQDSKVYADTRDAALEKAHAWVKEKYPESRRTTMFTGML